ncbi:MAG: PEP-CTERM sorting domain-containing protein [Lacipirellulaceae bacterium]
MTKKLTKLVLSAVIAVALGGSASAVTSFDQNVTPDVIFGSGNANGGFTVDTDNGVELGLRAKLRHNAVGAPENTFNSNGDGTYTFKSGVAPTQSFPTAEWSFEWSVNSNADGTSSYDLDDLTYELSLDSDPGPGTSLITFDPINGFNPGTGAVLWDHSIGDNSTTSATDSIAANAGDYATLIANNNVAQNSWKPHWFIAGFDPTVNGEYTISLTAFDGSVAVASSSIIVNAVPEPATFALGGLALLGVACGRRRRA